jgi:hypothetical protein
MNMKLMQLKEELKELAKLVRYNRNEYRNAQRCGSWEDQNKFSIYRSFSWDYRHMHIAYCLLRGRTMQQIENKNRENNEPNQSLIRKYMEQYREETICANS